MRINAKWLLGAVAIGGLAFAGTSTFTAGSTVPATQEVGFAQTTVTGGTVSDVAYTLDTSNPPNLTAFTLTVDTSGTTSAPSVQYAINGGTMASCSAGSYTSGQASTTYTCTLGTAVAASSVTDTEISIATQ